MADLKKKSKIKAEGGISLPTETIQRAPIIDANGEIKSSSVTSTELSYVSGVTSAIQTQLGNNATAITDHVNDATAAHAASAVANTPAGGIAATDVQGAINELDTEKANLASPTFTGTVSGITKSMVGLGNVDNTSDADKPVSTATQTALDGKVDENAAITGATKTKITYDAKGLVTAGADATTADIADSTDKRYVTDAQLVVVGNTSGTNTGDQNAAGVASTPSGNLAASNVQAALNELQSDIDGRASASDLSNHLSDTTDAHDASAISNVPAGSIAATDVQAAINELDGDIGAVASDVADLVTLSGVAANSSNLGTFTGSTIADSSTVKSALQALETELEAIPNPFYYAGVWAASTNTPTLDNTDTGVTGAVYYVTDSGTVDFGAGNITFAAGDRVANNGTTWDKWDMTDAVASVFGRTGAVTAQSGDYTASQVTNVPAGTIAAVTVQAAINELEGDVVAAQGDATQALSDAADAQTDINDHIADTVGAHAASAIANTPSGNLSATTVQAALNELQGDVDALPVASTGDISETSFTIANNQVAVANVTGFAFGAAVVRGFKALVSIEIDATLDLYETYELIGINKSGSFDMAQSAVGDDSGILFSITSAGQVQYTSANYSGFVAGAIKFRAVTTSF